MRIFDAGHGEGTLDTLGWTKPTVTAPTQQGEDGISRGGVRMEWDPRCLRLHRLATKDARGADDNRLAFQVVVDADEDLGIPLPTESPLGQQDYYSARNRSTRFVDAEGRAAILPSLARIVDSRDARYGLALSTAFRDLGSQPSRLPGAARAGTTTRRAVEAELDAGAEPRSLVYAPPLKGKRVGAVAPLESVFVPHAGLLDVGRGREGTPERLHLAIRWDAQFAIDLQAGDGPGSGTTRGEARAKWCGPLAIADADAATIRHPRDPKLYKGELWPDSSFGQGGSSNMQLVPVVAVDADLPIPEPEERTRQTEGSEPEESMDSAEEDDFDDIGGLLDELDEEDDDGDPGDPGRQQRRRTDSQGKPCVLDPGTTGYVVEDGNVVVQNPDGTGVILGPLGPDFDPGFGFRDPIRDPATGFTAGPTIPGSEFNAVALDDASDFAQGAGQGGAVISAYATPLPRPGAGVAGGLLGYLHASHALLEDQRQLARAVFGDGVYEGNLGVINRTPTPAASVLGQHVIARDRGVKFSQRGLEVPGILESRGGTINASGAVFEVWREHRGQTSAIRDDRALIRLGNRGPGARRSTGALIEEDRKRFGVGSDGGLHATEVGALSVPGEPVGRGFYTGTSVDGALSGTPTWQVGTDGVQQIGHQADTPEAAQDGTTRLYYDSSGTLKQIASDGTVSDVGGSGGTFPGSAVDGNLVSFDGTSGDTFQDSGIAASSVLTGSMGAADNALVRTDGTGGKTTQGTGIVVDDSDVMTSVTAVGLVTQSADPFGGAATGLWNDNSAGTARPTWTIAGTNYSIPFVSLSGINDGDVPAWDAAGASWTLASGGASTLSAVLTAGNATGSTGIVCQNNVGITGDGYLSLTRDPGGIGASFPAHILQDDRAQSASINSVVLKVAATANTYNFSLHNTLMGFYGGPSGNTFMGAVFGRRTGTTTGYVGLMPSTLNEVFTVKDASSVQRVAVNAGGTNAGVIAIQNGTAASVYTPEGSTHGHIYVKNGQLIYVKPGTTIEKNLCSSTTPGDTTTTNTADDGSGGSGATLDVENDTVTIGVPASGSTPITVSTPFVPGILQDIVLTVSVALGTGGGLTGFQVGDGTDVDRWGEATTVTKNTVLKRENWTVTNERLYGYYITLSESGTLNVVITPVGGTWDGGTIIMVFFVHNTTVISY